MGSWVLINARWYKPGGRTSVHGGGRAPFFTMLALAGVLGAATWLFSGSLGEVPSVTVSVPALSARAAAGRDAFARLCATCHGADGGGGDRGPPLVHPVYARGHHADPAFRLALARGVRQHHWCGTACKVDPY